MTGVLCGSCLSNWTGGFNQMCSECPFDSKSNGLVLIVVFGVAVISAAVILYRWLSKAQGNLQERLDLVRAKYALAKKAARTASRIGGELNDIAADEGSAYQSVRATLKIVIGNLQVISESPGTQSVFRIL